MILLTMDSPGGKREEDPGGILEHNIIAFHVSCFLPKFMGWPSAARYEFSEGFPYFCCWLKNFFFYYFIGLYQYLLNKGVN